jgi:Holliday junction resolvasome RuvABC endonuclease subunit
MNEPLLFAVDQGQAHCGWVLVRHQGGRVVSVVTHGECSLATHWGRAAMRAALAESARLGCRRWAHERPWHGTARGQGGDPRRGARIRAGQARTLGQLAEMAEGAGITAAPPLQVPASSAKLALTGHGGAQKRHMIAAAQLRFGITVSEHTADALGVALAAARALWLEGLRQGQRAAAGPASGDVIDPRD